MRCSLPAVHDVLLPPQGTAVHLERERRDVADGIDVGAARLEAAVDLWGGGAGEGEQVSHRDMQSSHVGAESN